MLAVTLLTLACGLAASRFGRIANAAEKAGGGVRDINSLITSLTDLQASIHVTKLDLKELEKIGGDFSVPYRIRNLTLQYKQPDKMRLSGRIPILGEAVLISNGALRFYSVPRMDKKVEDLQKTPSRRITLLEYGGILSPETLHFMEGHFVREENWNDHPALVFDMIYQGAASASHYRLWIDPDTHITCKREWYDRENRLRATFLYQEPREVAPDIWLPTRVVVKNAEGNVAAATTLNDMKVNQGLPDDLFAIRP
jgi:outer membrane lipoprotein-sorting protein